MTQAYLEHANLSVTDPDSVAATFVNLFDWRVRWSGASMDDGYTVHVGGDDSYLAFYTNAHIKAAPARGHSTLLNMNHVAVVVNDLEQTEQRARELGLEPFNHGTYDPGQRFYINLADDLEVEVVHYPKPAD